MIETAIVANFKFLNPNKTQSDYETIKKDYIFFENCKSLSYLVEVDVLKKNGKISLSLND
jgi:hypothetical protein